MGRVNTGISHRLAPKGFSFSSCTLPSGGYTTSRIVGEGGALLTVSTRRSGRFLDAVPPFPFFPNAILATVGSRIVLPKGLHVSHCKPYSSDDGERQDQCFSNVPSHWWDPFPGYCVHVFQILVQMATSEPSRNSAEGAESDVVDNTIVFVPLLFWATSTRRLPPQAF